MLSLSEMVEKIRALCKQNGTSITKLEENFGWANGSIGKWAKGKRYPPSDRIRMIAEYFNVPVSYLTGESEQKEKPTRSGEPKNPILADIYKMLDGCSEEELNLAKARLQKIIESRGE